MTDAENIDRLVTALTRITKAAHNFLYSVTSLSLGAELHVAVIEATAVLALPPVNGLPGVPVAPPAPITRPGIPQ